LRVLTDQWPEDISWQQQETLPVTSANAATTEVGRTFRQYQWNLRDLVQVWASEPSRIGLSLRIDSNKTSGTHERNFRTRDCPPSLCTAEQRPRLLIQFSVPPTPTPTFTPTPTATPTPTPGIAELLLAAEPRGAIEPQHELTYTISYRNGPYPLDGVKIANPLPENVLFVTDSILSSRAAMTGVYDAILHTVAFTLTGQLEARAQGTVSYRVVRPAEPELPTPSTAAAEPPTALRTDDGFVVFNEGAEMRWLYQGKESVLKSNFTRNPGIFAYLPVVSR
jgi:uncharacterized repeat protein (TIGR01451 family)